MIESHPGVPLIDHLKAVAFNCTRIAKISNTDVSFSQATKESLAYICGVFHDLGKATSYFQEYLQYPEDNHSSLKNHALPSAIFVFYVVKQFLESVSTNDKNYSFFLASTCFCIVKRHHGHLRNFKNEISIGDKEADLLKQYESIPPSYVQDLIDDCLSEFDFNIKWNDFVSWVNSGGFNKDAKYGYLDFELDQLDCWSNQKKSLAYYFFLWMFGTLLYSDKSDVILSGSFPELSTPEIKYLDQFRTQNGFDSPTNEINRLKNDAYFSVLDKLESDFDQEKRFYSITLPTGFGKTLTSLGAAIKLQKISGLKQGKIIIAIPFTSIIDQNFQVYQEVFRNPDNNKLLKHHHFSEPIYKEGEDTVRNEDESQYLIETWQSSIVVTTFVQLLECLITNDKSKLLKFPSLSNSVILMDEVQQIPHELWLVVRQALFTITSNLNCYIILMSATQPLIFRPKTEIKELVSDYQKFFSVFNRTKLINKITQSISLENFINEVVQYTENNPSRDILIILNTKKITLDCFRELKNRLDENNELRYLTTLITPYERKRVISEIKEKKQNKRYIIVSTQLVEAGVDISVNTVFRALAPLDSVIQAAGRANRYNEKKEISEIFLYKIDEQYNISCRLYGKALMLKTELVLGDSEIIEEKNYLKLIKSYFQEIKELSDYSEKQLLTDLLSLNFEDTGRFKLIEEIESESIFIALNNDAIELWNEFVKINEDNLSPLERKKSFSKIKSRFYDYVINVPIPYNQRSLDLPIEPYYGFYYWEFGNSQHEIYSYDDTDKKKNEGFIFEKVSAISF